jgi:hypothetical protein
VVVAAVAIATIITIRATIKEEKVVERRAVEARRDPNLCIREDELPHR